MCWNHRYIFCRRQIAGRGTHVRIRKRFCQSGVSNVLGESLEQFYLIAASRSAMALKIVSGSAIRPGPYMPQLSRPSPGSIS
jgi:hypothetical protein